MFTAGILKTPNCTPTIEDVSRAGAVLAYPTLQAMTIESKICKGCKFAGTTCNYAR